jgi:alpha-glucosidase
MKVTVIFWCAVFTASLLQSGEILRSPNGHLELSFALKDVEGENACPVYRVSYQGKLILADSRLGLSVTDGPNLENGFELQNRQLDDHDSYWTPIYGERSVVRDHYNQLTVTLSRGGNQASAIDLVFRCYDEGVAFRYEIPKQNDSTKRHVTSELTEFSFTQDHPAWCVNSAQGVYSRKSIDSMGSGVERPLVIEVNDHSFVAIAEAGLVDYARMKLRASNKRAHTIQSELSSDVRYSLPLKTPWRVLMVGDSPGALLENNDLILNLNEANAIEDPSWIKPGKVIREVTLTTQGGKACVDFAAKNKLQYVEFDAGWYGNEYDDTSDATTVTVDPKRSPGPLDLPDVIQYANERGIGILLYVNRRALERQLDELLPLYQQWGVKGLKYGFVNVGSQAHTSWLHEAIRKAAAHRLMVDVHDEYRPTGYSRTYPNFMTQEGIGGDETAPTNEQTLTILFTRMLAGAGDNTICYYDDRVDRNASHAYQLAKAVCFYSPWQFLYWYDRPEGSPRRKGGAGGQKGVIGDEPELEFYKNVPTVWDDTKVLQGSIGQYAVMARRSGSEWFIGCMNSGEGRTFDIALDFLNPEREYLAHVYSDDEQIQTRTRVRIDRLEVNATTVLTMQIGKQGGQAVHIIPK